MATEKKEAPLLGMGPCALVLAWNAIWQEMPADKRPADWPRKVHQAKIKLMSSELAMVVCNSPTCSYQLMTRGAGGDQQTRDLIDKESPLYMPVPEPVRTAPAGDPAPVPGERNAWDIYAPPA